MTIYRYLAILTNEAQPKSEVWAGGDA